MITCCICFREETATAPTGAIRYPARTNYGTKRMTTGILCSKCTMVLLLSGVGQIPWDGNFKNKTKTKLRRRGAEKMIRRYSK